MIKIGRRGGRCRAGGLAGYGVGKAANPAGQPQESRQVAPKNGGPGPNDQPASPHPPAGTAAPGPKETQSKAPVRIISGVDGEVTIISLPELGTHFKKGDVICRLDSAAIRDQLLGQRIVVESAKADYQNARLTREVAEIAVVEYQEGESPERSPGHRRRPPDRRGGTGPRRRRTQSGQVDGRRVRHQPGNQAGRARRLPCQGRDQEGQGPAGVLVDYTKARMIKQLKADVEKARSDELSKQSIWDLEKTKEARLERQLANATIVAPIDGYIMNYKVGEGFKVHEHQTLFEIVPDDGQAEETLTSPQHFGKESSEILASPSPMMYRSGMTRGGRGSSCSEPG